MRKHALFEFSNTHYTIQRENAQVKSGEFSMNFCFAPSLSCPCSVL